MAGAIMSFFLIVVFRLVIVLSIPLVFVGSLYTLMWVSQIYRAVRRGRTSGLTAEYVVGTTLCRLYYILCKFYRILFFKKPLIRPCRFLGMPEEYPGCRTAT